MCRRKWYSRRSTNPPTPRDTNTSQVLSAPTPHGTPVREGTDIRNPNQLTPSFDTQVVLAVEELVKSMEALEALERSDTFRLEHNLRVCLQQVQGRIHPFICRYISAQNVYSGHIPRRQTRAVAHSTVEASGSRQEDSAVAESTIGHRPYPLSRAAFRTSTVSLPELCSPVQANSQSTNTANITPPLSGDYLRGSVALSRRSSQLDDAIASPVSTAEPRVEAAAQFGYQSNMTLPQPSSRVREEVNARGLRDHLRMLRHNSSRNTSIPASGLRNTSHISLPDIAELEGDTPPPTFLETSATQVPVTDRPNQHAQHPVQARTHGDDHTSILYPRFQNAFLHRIRSTQGLSPPTQPVSAPQTPVLANSVAERGEGLESRAAAARSTRGLSRIMSMSNLRDMMGGSRSR